MTVQCATTESYTIRLLESSYGNIPRTPDQTIAQMWSKGVRGGATAREYNAVNIIPNIKKNLP